MRFCVIATRTADLAKALGARYVLQVVQLGQNLAPTMTLSAWGALDEDVSGELVDGRLEEEEMASFVHELVVMWLGSLLRSWLAARGGFVFASEAKYAVAPARGRKPDLSAFISPRKPPASGVCSIPPDLIVEVISPTPKDGRRDRVDKLSEYAAFGVRYYWLVDPALRTLEILELGADGRYAHAQSASNGQLDSIPGFEGLSIDLDALWQEVDRLAQAEVTGDMP